MNMSYAKRNELMKHVVKLNRMHVDEDSSLIGDENNNMGKRNMDAMIEDAKNIIEVDTSVKRQQQLDNLCENYSFERSFEVNLPIMEKQQKIKTFIASYPFCIIQGGTGKRLQNLLIA